MSRNFYIGFLSICCGLSIVNVGLADEAIGTSPIIAQPYNVQALNQQMLDRDRMNRDEEIAIKELIEENDKLTQSTLARQQDEGLVKVNQTMLNYRDSLVSRDQQRIAANGVRWSSRYGDLIKLTEDADAMTIDRGLLEDRSGLIAEKYKMLSDLKDEMTALNDKLRGESGDTLNQKETVMQGYKKVEQEQQDKIQMLVQRLSEMDQKMAQKDQQIALLKNNLSSAESQIAILQQQAQELSLKGDHIKSQADHMENLVQQANNHSAISGNAQAQVDYLKNQIQLQAEDLKAKEESIRWLNQVVAAAKNKAEYYKLTSQQDQLSMKDVQEQVQKIKDDFAQRFKNYDQFENTIASLKNQVDLLKSELEDKITEQNTQVQQEQKTEQGLKTQLQDKLDQITRMKEEIQAIRQDQANKEINARKAADLDDRMELARQLIGLHQQEAVLLQEKSALTMQQFPLLDEHVAAYENRIKVLMANHRVQDMDFRERLEGLKNHLSQNQQEMDSLKQQLEGKIANQKNQEQLELQIQDLKTQVQDKQNQIAKMKAQIQGQVDTETLKDQIAEQQDKIDLLKQQLEGKISESNKMTLMMADYQKKLESKNNTYNEQLDKNVQAKDLSLYMMDEKIKEDQNKINGLQAALARSRQTPEGIPSSDEISFLRAGLQKATLQLKQKEQMLSQIKANADEYSREFKAQSQEFQNLKEQLQSAREEIDLKKEDLKYKDMDLIRFKARSKMSEVDLQKQVRVLTRELDAAKKRLMGKTHENKVEALEAQLKNANLQIKELQAQLNQFTSPSKNDSTQEKLKQALDKIQEQGRAINVLAQKLQDAGQTADLPRS